MTGGQVGAVPRPIRQDAQRNRQRVLAAAAVTVRREGLKVPMETIARDAGVGIATVYRHFASRSDLLAGLTERSYRLVLEHARTAADHDGPALDAIARFLDATIERRAELILPLHGGPPSLDRQSSALRAEISGLLEDVLRRGREDGTIRRDVAAIDLIVFGAMLAQPLAHVPDWDRVARRQAQVFLAGLADVDDAPLPGRPLTRADLDARLTKARQDRPE